MSLRDRPAASQARTATSSASVLSSPPETPIESVSFFGSRESRLTSPAIWMAKISAHRASSSSDSSGTKGCASTRRASVARGGRDSAGTGDASTTRYSQCGLRATVIKRTNHAPIVSDSLQDRCRTVTDVSAIWVGSLAIPHASRLVEDRRHFRQSSSDHQIPGRRSTHPVPRRRRRTPRCSVPIGCGPGRVAMLLCQSSRCSPIDSASTFAPASAA